MTWKWATGSASGVAIIFAALPAVTGCAPFGSGEAARLSRVLLDQTVEYQNLVETKMRTERASYRERLEDLRKSLVEQGETGEDIALNRAAQDFHFAVVNSRSDILPRDVREAMASFIASIRAERRERAEAEREAIENLASSLEALELHRRSLEQVRKNLEQLQAEKSTVKTVRDWVEFGKDVKKALDKEDPEQPAGGGAPASPQPGE